MSKETKAVATTSQANGVKFIIPLAKKEDLINFDRMIKQAHRELEEALIAGNDTLAAMIQVQAYKALEDAISPEILRDFRLMENTERGFKTDRVAGTRDKSGNAVQPYSDQVIKRVIIGALSKGARLIDNEFNVIAGNLYLTKNFYMPRVKRFPGLTELKILWGVPSQSGSGKGWLYPAKASWKLNGRPDSIECLQTKDFDSRIVVRGYESSSVDEIRGKAEAKLYRWIFERVSGINIEAAETFESLGDDLPAAPMAIDCDKLPEPTREQLKPAAGQGTMFDDAEDPAVACAKMMNDFEAGIAKVTDKDSIPAIVEDRMQAVESTDWPNQVKVMTKAALNRMAKARFEALS